MHLPFQFWQVHNVMLFSKAVFCVVVQHDVFYFAALKPYHNIESVACKCRKRRVYVQSRKNQKNN